MKPSQSMLVLFAFVFGCSLPAFSQQVLPEVEIVAVNYKYLSALNNKEVSPNIKDLERRIAEYDLKNADFYEDVYDTYVVSFYIPEGQVLAAYDKEGKLLRTAEKYKNTNLPLAVSKAIANKYPDWSISKDVYLVKYHEKNGITKRYKVQIMKGGEKKRVKLNENGEFL